MATIRTEKNAGNGTIIYDYICDTMEDMASIDLAYTMVGSTCMVLYGTNGKLTVYRMTEEDGWQLLQMDNASHAANAIRTHVCDQVEISDSGLPIIEEPDSNTYYLIPINAGTNNIYKEYIWLNDAWELFGSVIDIPDKNKIDALDNAAYKDVDTALVTNSGSTNLPTSTAVMNYLNAQLDQFMTALSERIQDIENIIHISNSMMENEESKPITTEAEYTIEFDII